MFNQSAKSSRALAIRLTGILLLMAILAGLLPGPALAASPAAVTTCNTKYTVKSGDTLSGIAQQYKINWLDLAAANDLKSPYTIYIGQILCVPKSSSTTTSGSTSSSSKAGFSLALQGRFLTVTAFNYPKNSIFYVKVGEGRFSLEPPVYKIGMLRMRKSASVVTVYRLPKDLSDVRYVRVCLKNVRTDAIACRSIKRY